MKATIWQPLLMNSLEDVTTDKRASIRHGLEVFDQIRLNALSSRDSLELIRRRRVLNAMVARFLAAPYPLAGIT